MAQMRRAACGLVFAAAALACTSAAAATDPFDFGCQFILGDYEYGWSADVAPEPVDVAYARNAAHNLWYVDVDDPWWRTHTRDTPADLLPSGTSTWSLPDGGTATQTARIRRRADGAWSRQRGVNRWVYDLTLHTPEIKTTVCRPSGGCTTRVRDERLVDWAVCATGQRLPYRLELLGQQTRVRPGGPPAWLRMRLTHGGLPVREGALVTEALSRYQRLGEFDCLPQRCPWPFQVAPDPDGQFELHFNPRSFQPGTIPLSFGCSDCENRVETTLQVQPEIVVGFFNGVANTRHVAQLSMDRLEVEFGKKFYDASLEYDWFYNQTACGKGVLGKVSCLEDVAEVFEQRSHELGGVFVNRWETFWDILSGRHQQPGSITGRLTHLLGAGGHAVLQWLDATANAAINQLAAGTLALLTLFTDSPTQANQAGHLERLTRHADDGARLLLVAHSQGNLFANSAHDALRAARPGVALEVVHVAPASATLRGEHVLADIDLVINSLRLTGLNSVPAANLALPPSTRDATGHGFEPTYLDTLRAAHARTRGLITRSLDILATQPTGSHP